MLTFMKPVTQDSVGAAMATKCSSSVTMVTEYTVHKRSHRSHRHAYANHRKSAVELLEASKGEYVKSRKVLNHKQNLKHPENLCVGNRELVAVPINGKLSPTENAVTGTAGAATSTSVSGPAATSEQKRDSSPTIFAEKFVVFETNCHSLAPSVTVALPVPVCASTAADNSSATSSAEFSEPTSILSSVSSVLTSLNSQNSFQIANTTSISGRKSSVVSAAVSVKSADLPLSAVKRPTNSPPAAKNSSSPPSAAKKLSTTSSFGSSVSYTSNNSIPDNGHTIFKKPVPLTSPTSPTGKPVVPPKPACKLTVTPKVPKRGLKPGTPSTTEKPVPPPRPPRKVSTTKTAVISNEKPDSNEKTMSSADRKSAMSSSNQASNGSDQKRFSSLSVGACNQASNDSEQKRFSSVSASAYETSSKESDSVDSSKAKCRSARESRYSSSSQNDGFLKPLCSNSLSTSVGVLVERKRSPVLKPRIDKQLNEIELPPRRPLHRSQSDLSNCRHSRTSSDFSDLSSRLSRTSTEVERFFNEMGIDHSVLEPMRRLSETKHKENLDSVSSLDSFDVHSLSSRLSNDLDRMPMESEQDLSERDAGTTSVVERNARIIKWLCNVKKARTVQTKTVKRKT